MPDAGWYEDPADPRQLRYWDGAAWTDAVSSVPDPPARSLPGLGGGSPGYVGPQGFGGPPGPGWGRPITNWMPWAIIVTILCFWPLGIPAIVYASKANSAAARGDPDAQRLAGLAQLFTILTAGIGVAVAAIVLIAVAAGGGGGTQT